MSVAAMNHFTILTDDLQTTLAFYTEHLELRAGDRPPFAFDGAWLYAKDGRDPILHIIAGRPKAQLVPGVIDHMAFTGKGLAAAVKRLEKHAVPYELRRLPGDWGTWQLFFHDPNGAKIEIDFDRSEPAPGGSA